jgi:hypothetical protein
MIGIGGRVHGVAQTVSAIQQIPSLIRQGGERTMHRSLDYLSEVMRKNYLSGPYPTEIERRGGSFQASWRRGHPQNIHEVEAQGTKIHGRLGSKDRRAKILAVGGTIRPTGGRQFLAIPTERAKTPRGVTKAEFDRPLRQIPGLFLQRARSGGLFAARKRGSGLEVLFNLVRQATIRGRHYDEKAVRKATPGVQGFWRDLVGTILGRAQQTIRRVRGRGA